MSLFIGLLTAVILLQSFSYYIKTNGFYDQNVTSLVSQFLLTNHVLLIVVIFLILGAALLYFRKRAGWTFLQISNAFMMISVMITMTYGSRILPIEFIILNVSTGFLPFLLLMMRPTRIYQQIRTKNIIIAVAVAILLAMHHYFFIELIK